MKSAAVGGLMNRSEPLCAGNALTDASALRLAASAVLLATACSVLMAKPAASNPTSSARELAAFAAAKREWVRGSRASSYQTSRFLRGCAEDLTRAIAADVDHRDAYHSAVAWLLQLAALPETSDTPAQIRTAHRDLTSLNRFFDTKNLYE